jgi:NAD(P)-dependent dehydrogenase (short-subunit alcohol dehydrogenase family)
LSRTHLRNFKTASKQREPLFESLADELKTHGGKVLALATDVTRREQVARLVDANAEVVVFTTSPGKLNDVKRLGAREAVLWSDNEGMKRLASERYYDCSL